MAGCFLFNRNGRRKTFDEIHIGLVHALQELPGVCRKRFHIPALPFGIKGVKGKGRFPGSRQTGDNHKFIARQLDIDIFQIMLSGTLYDNTFR